MAYKKQGKSLRSVFLPKVKRWRRDDWDWMTHSQFELCQDDKVIYRSTVEAEEKRKELQETYLKPLRVYECRYGPHWHLTSQV